VSYRPVLIALLLVLTVPGVASASSSTQIIVKRAPGLSAAERADIRAGAQVRFVETLPLPRTEVVRAARDDVGDAVRDLNADPDVVYAERDRIVRASSQDSFFTEQWGLDNRGDLLGAVEDADMDVPEAWGLSTGTGVVVAVVDSGVDAGHDDLGGRIRRGWDYVGDHPYVTDPNGHGTHVAGTIAATRDNGIGVAGVAPDARILPIRVLDADGSGYVSDVVKAFDYAAGRGVRLVNASLGSDAPSTSEMAAIAAHPGVTFVVAAGNGGDDGVGDDNDGSAAEYPCAYDLANIVCAGASRPDDAPAAFSNFGESSVDVFAPGYDIVSTFPGDVYARGDGTSMAAPHVAGEAALLLSLNPSLGSVGVKAAIIDSADKPLGLDDLSVSDGRANANEALVSSDYDGDGVKDWQDNCPGIANPNQGDECSPAADADGDSVPVPTDLCPYENAAYAADGCPSADPTADGDYWPDAVDACPAAAGSVRGCPDADGDGVADAGDNCPTAPNEDQTDGDGDRRGDSCDGDRDGDTVPNAQDQCPLDAGSGANGCDPLPPIAPADSDRDGVADATDACPNRSAPTRNGCPLAEIAAVSAKVKRRSATIRVTTTRPAMVKMTVERRKGRRWVRVARRTEASFRNRATLRVSRLRRGTHRVRVSISSSAGRGTSVSKTFRIR
jgi:subtilisin family serine protease